MKIAVSRSVFLYVSLLLLHIYKNGNVFVFLNMIIKTLKIDQNHYSTSWVPISYKLNKKCLNKSHTFLWSINYNVIALCRIYYITSTKIEIGDLWINNYYRGKYNKYGIKYSLAFMRKVIAKIWKIYPSIFKISLIVSNKNLPAIKLYKKLNFIKSKTITNSELTNSNSFYMTRYKRGVCN